MHSFYTSLSSVFVCTLLYGPCVFNPRRTGIYLSVSGNLASDCFEYFGPYVFDD